MIPLLGSLTTLNKISFGLLFLTKFCGIAALAAGFAGMASFGAFLLCIAGASLATIISFSIYQMYRKNDGVIIEEFET